MSAPEKILVCLLSDQQIPNLLSIHALKRDHLVLIETPKMKETGKARHLLEALKCGGLDFDGRSTRQSIKHEDSISDTLASLRAVYSIFPSAKWTANITGGTKIMSIAAYEFFKAMGADIFYIEVSKPDELRQVLDGKTISCARSLTCKEFLRAYGFSFQDTSASEQFARKLLPLARAIARQPDALKLDLSDEQRKQLRKGKLALEPGMIQISGKPLIRAFQKELDRRRRCRHNSELVPFGLEESSPGSAVSLTGKIDKYTGEFLSGGWLEAFLFCLLDKHRKPLEIPDVHMGIKPFTDDKEGGNDLDVAFIRRYAFCVMECKTGMSHDRSFDALYKLEAVLEQSRALLRKSYFATTDTQIYEKNSTIPQEHLLRRAKLYGCTLILPDQLQELANAQTPDQELERLRQILDLPK